MLLTRTIERIPVIGFILLVALLIGCTPDEAPPATVLSGTDSVTTFVDQSILEDSTRYAPVWILSTTMQFPPGTHPTPDLIREAEADAATRIVERVNARTSRDYLQNTYVNDFLHRIYDEEVIYEGPRDVYPARVTHFYDYDAGMLQVKLECGFARVSRMLPVRILEYVLRSLDEEQYLLVLDHGGIRIEIDKVVLLISDADSFRERIQELLDSPGYKGFLDFADQATRHILENVYQTGRFPVKGFRSGSYELSSLMTATIQAAVVPVVERYTRQYKVVEIHSIGHADRNPVKGAIHYFGSADLTQQAGRLIPYAPENEYPVEDQIINNVQLSFARGHVGITGLYQLLSGKTYFHRLRFSYAGKGSALSTRDFPGSRRIVYEIIPQKN